MGISFAPKYKGLLMLQVEAFVAVLNAYLSLIVIIGSETVTRELSSNVLDVLVMDTQLSKHVSG